MLPLYKSDLEFRGRETILKFREKLWVLLSSSSFALSCVPMVSFKWRHSFTYLGTRLQVAWLLLQVSNPASFTPYVFFLSFLLIPFGSFLVLIVSFHFHRLHLCFPTLYSFSVRCSSILFKFCSVSICCSSILVVWFHLTIYGLPYELWFGAKSWWVLELEHWSNSN